MSHHTSAFSLSPSLPLSPSSLRKLCGCTPPAARISHTSATYRRTALLSSIRTTSAPNVTTTVPETVTTPAPPQQKPRYTVRTANVCELYTVADIRCEAFYGQPKNPHHFPVRRREIYTAMRDRLRTGNKCIILLDTIPPHEWHSFTTTDGSLVVASLDVSLHETSGGQRTAFSAKGVKGERAMYISSMAVREQWQRQGLAQRLLRYVKVMADSHAVSELFLHVEAENSVAIHVYRKCGFELVDSNSEGAHQWLSFLAKKEHLIMRKVLA